MLRLLLLVALLTIHPIGSERARAQGRFSPPPPPGPTPTHAPLHDSAVLALAASAAATGALVWAGYALIDAHPPGTHREGEVPWGEIGAGLLGIGIFVGPSVGNLTLGAADYAGMGLYVRALGLGAGTMLFLGAIPLCIPIGEPSGPLCDLARALMVGGAGVAAGGIVAGAVYDVATLPRSAARAHRQRVTLGPALTPGGPGLGLRVRL